MSEIRRMDNINSKQNPNTILSKSKIDSNWLDNAQIRSWNTISSRIKVLGENTKMETNNQPNLILEEKLSTRKKFLLPFGISILGTLALVGIFVLVGQKLIPTNSTNYTIKDSTVLNSQLASNIEKTTGLTVADLEFLKANGIVQVATSRTSNEPAIFASISPNNMSTGYGGMNGASKLVSNDSNTNATLDLTKLDPAVKEKTEKILAKIPRSTDLVVRKYITSLSDESLEQMFYYINPDLKNNQEYNDILSQTKKYSKNTLTEQWQQGVNFKNVSRSTAYNYMTLNAMITDGNILRSYNYQGGKYAIESTNNLDSNPCIECSSQTKDQGLISAIYSDPDLSFAIQIMNPYTENTGYKYIGNETIDGRDLSVYEMIQSNDLPIEKVQMGIKIPTIVTKVYFDMDEMKKVIERQYMDGKLMSENKLISYERIPNGKVNISELSDIEIKPAPINNSIIPQDTTISKVSQVTDDTLIFSFSNMKNLYMFNYYNNTSSPTQAMDDLYNNVDFNPMYEYQKKFSELMNVTMKAVNMPIVSYMLLGNDKETNINQTINISVYDKVGIQTDTLLSQYISGPADPTTTTKTETKDIDIYLNNTYLTKGRLATQIVTLNQSENPMIVDSLVFEYNNKTYLVNYSEYSDSKSSNYSQKVPLVNNVVDIHKLSDSDINENSAPINPNANYVEYKTPSETGIDNLIFDIDMPSQVNFSANKSSNWNQSDIDLTGKDYITYFLDWNTSSSILDNLWGVNSSMSIQFNVFDKSLSKDQMKDYINTTELSWNTNQTFEIKDITVDVNGEKYNGIYQYTHTTTGGDSDLLVFNYKGKTYSTFIYGNLQKEIKKQADTGEIKMKVLEDKDIIPQLVTPNRI